MSQKISKFLHNPSPYYSQPYKTTSASCSREMRAQGEMLRGEMESQESRQRAAIDELVEAIDVRTQVAELGEDVRWEYYERAK